MILGLVRVQVQLPSHHKFPFSESSVQLRIKKVTILLEFAEFINICIVRYLPRFPILPSIPSDYSLSPWNIAMAMKFLLTAFLPFYNCFGYPGEAASSSHPGLSAYGLSRNTTLIPLDTLGPVLEDGPTQMDGCSGYRRHYIKRELSNNKYEMACQMSRCYMNSGGYTVTYIWTEYINIEEGELCRSKRGKELLDDYLFRKSNWWWTTFPV